MDENAKDLGLPETIEVPYEEKEKFFESTRNKLGMVAIAVIAVVAWFAGLFPDLQTPVVNMDVANTLVNAVSIVVTALIVGRTIRNTPTGSGVNVLTFVSELLKMLVASKDDPVIK